MRIRDLFSGVFLEGKWYLDALGCGWFKPEGFGNTLIYRHRDCGSCKNDFIKSNPTS